VYYLGTGEESSLLLDVRQWMAFYHELDQRWW